MNTRRKFLLQGSMATAAVTLGNSFKSIASTISPLTGFSINNKKIVLLHTAVNNSTPLNYTINQINLVKQNAHNMLLIHPGNASELAATGVRHDVTMQDENKIAGLNDAYSVIYKGDIKIGIIKTAVIQSDIIGCVNTLSQWLKEEKKCNLVVCLSQLGYKNTGKTDDLQLAEKSTHLDVIINGHPVNFKNTPVITHNSNNAEVIIQSACDSGFGLGNIEIGFDRNNKKYSIDFNNLLKRSSATS